MTKVKIALDVIFMHFIIDTISFSTYLAETKGISISTWNKLVLEKTFKHIFVKFSLQW